jgi:NCS1 family nucleobase:cation symporter-1
VAEIRGIEARSIDYVPPSERHGKVWQQGLFWFLGNFQFFTITLGFVGVSLGLSVGDTVLAGTLGVAFGTLFMAFHATQGPHLGLPQMVQSRAQLGYSGVVVALFGSFAMYMLFNVVDVILLSAGLNGLFGWDPALIAIGTTVVAAGLAIYGHDVLHRAFRVLFVVSVPVFSVLTAAVVLGGSTGLGAGGGTASEFTWTAFVGMFVVGAAYNITYAPYVSDYSRYLPRSTRTAPIVTSVYLGAAGAAAWLIALGAWLAANLGTPEVLVALQGAGDRVVAGFGLVLVVVSVTAGVATMGINAYGAMLSAITAFDSIRPLRPTRRLRVVTIALLAAAWGLAGMTFGGRSVEAVYNVLVVMLYLLVPWTAINLVDYFFVRRGRYAIVDLFDPAGIYGRWAWRGLVAFAIGLISMAPFYVIPGVFEGPVAVAIGGADISAIVGLATSSVAYYLLTRSLDVSAERPAIEASEMALARE